MSESDTQNLEAPPEEYYRIQMELVVQRAQGTLPPEREDEILNRLDELWWMMSDEEHEVLEKRVAEVFKNYTEAIKEIEKEPKVTG